MGAAQNPSWVESQFLFDPDKSKHQQLPATWKLRRILEKLGAVFSSADWVIPGTFASLGCSELLAIYKNGQPVRILLVKFTPSRSIYWVLTRHWNGFGHQPPARKPTVKQGDGMCINNNQEVEGWIALVVLMREGLLLSRTAEKSSWRRDHVTLNLTEEKVLNNQTGEWGEDPQSGPSQVGEDTGEGERIRKTESQLGWVHCPKLPLFPEVSQGNWAFSWAFPWETEKKGYVLMWTPRISPT